MRLFAAHGYSATSIRDITREAGVTAPSLYHHFGNKEGLFLAIVRAGLARMEATRLEALQGGGSASDRIRRLCQAHSRLRRKYAHLTWVVERILSEPPENAPALDFRTIVRERTRHIEVLVEEGIARGEFRSCTPRHMALALIGAVDASSRSHLWGREADRSDEELLSIVNIVLSAITTSRPSAVVRRTARGEAGKARPRRRGRPG